MYDSYEDLILDRQELRDEDYDAEAPIQTGRRLEEIYPQLFR